MIEVLLTSNTHYMKLIDVFGDLVNLLEFLTTEWIDCQDEVELVEKCCRKWNGSNVMKV